VKQQRKQKTKIKAEPSKREKIIKGIAIFAFWILVWQLASMYVGYDILLVPPHKVALALVQLVQQADFWIAVSTSLYRIMLGYLFAVALGCLLALLGARFSLLHQVLYPLLSVIKATPVASFIILALIWIKSAYLSAFIAFMMVLPMIYSNLYIGLQNIDIKLLEVAQVFRFSKGSILRNIYLPSLKPYLLSACTVSLGFAWKSGVAAEVIGLPNDTIGNYLYYAKVHFNMAELFAWTVVIVLLSVLVEKVLVSLLKLLERR